MSSYLITTEPYEENIDTVISLKDAPVGEIVQVVTIGSIRFGDVLKIISTDGVIGAVCLNATYSNEKDMYKNIRNFSANLKCRILPAGTTFVIA